MIKKQRISLSSSRAHHRTSPFSVNPPSESTINTKLAPSNHTFTDASFTASDTEAICRAASAEYEFDAEETTVIAPPRI